jgi:hypothetical protein
MRRVVIRLDVEPVHVDHEADDRLNGTKNQQREVMTPSPKATGEYREDEARDDSQKDEAKYVVSVRDVVAADRLRGEQVTAQPGGKQYDTEPEPKGAVRVRHSNHRTLAAT